MTKIIAMLGTTLIGLAVSRFLPAQKPDGPPPPPEKKKGRGPADDLTKAYDALRRLQIDEARGGPPEERLRDWAHRAADLYRKGVGALDDGDDRLAHEYGAMAHDLARAVEHASNAARPDRGEGDLPLPPGREPGEDRDRVVRDLRRAYDRIRSVEGREPEGEAGIYLDAARDLYRAARRDAEDDHFERAGELARAAEAMAHVPEHMIHAERGPDGPPPEDRGIEEEKPEGSEPRGKLPPPID